MKYFIVVAHPDDEVLGAGALIWKWAHSGDKVDVCLMRTEAYFFEHGNGAACHSAFECYRKYESPERAI